MRFYTYDDREDIEKCLNCTKEECTNCLGNFFSAALTDKYDDEEEDIEE